MLKRKSLPLAKALIGIAFLWGSTVVAQDTDADADEDNVQLPRMEIEETVVTGTIIRRPETATASPVSVLSEQELDIRGLNTVADALTLLPANNAGTMGDWWSNWGFAQGASAISLRGLTAQATLVVMDGLRMAYYPLGDDGVRNFVDIGSIPDAIVQRIEILKDGASSTYGADAIAGVVNVITKKEVTGLHLNGSYGISQEGDGDEMRGDITWGTGDLEADGFNFYANVELQKNEALYFGDRGYPFNTSDWSGICNEDGVCMENWNSNGLQYDGTIYGVEHSVAPMFRPVDPATGDNLGNWRLFDPAAGCPEAYPFLIERHPVNAAEVGLTGPICESDDWGYENVKPQVERQGFTLRYTRRIGDRAEFYAMFNDYQVKTRDPDSPGWLWFSGYTSAGGPDIVRVGISPVYLPVYVCPLGENGYATCDASNGTLNPNNPFAADGQMAEVQAIWLTPPEYKRTRIETESVRYAAGLSGTFGADDLWDYTLEAVFGRVTMERRRRGRIPRRMLDVIYDGSFNFAHPEQNSREMLDYIAPLFMNRNTSELGQVQGTLTRPLFDLPGGTLVAAVGLSWRHEAVNAPNSNPAREDPYERYIGVNTVSAKGSRNSTAAFFEIDAPVADWLHINVSGRYDDYSTGQSKFSPKAGLQIQATDRLRLRGTYSKGFRIPSFHEGFGAAQSGGTQFTINPTTDWGRRFLAAHNYNAYASDHYRIELVRRGSPDIAPEKSESYTAGIVFEPLEHVSLTLDYWRIKINDLISYPNLNAAIEAYYQNDGNPDLPGFIFLPDVPDPDYPDALPRLGFVQFSSINVDSEIAEGIDLGVRFGRAFGAVHFTSHLEATHLLELSHTYDGVKERYEGTLSPCDWTSCSGAPDWRGTWVNAIDWDRWTFALTGNYTSGYDNASVDYGGVRGDCEASVYNSVFWYFDGSPYRCKHKSYTDWDFSATFALSERVQFYLNIINVFDKWPSVDPAPAYGLYGFNPAWEMSGWRGRYFRLGVRLDF